MRRHKTVADVMTTDVVTVTADTTFKDIAAVLAEQRFSAVPVLDAAGWVRGVVSETDLLRKEEFQSLSDSGWFARRGQRRARTKAAAVRARELMTSPAVTITPDASLPEAARRMADNDITRLVVTDGGRLAGIVTRSDLLKVFLATDEEIVYRIRHDVIEYALWDDPFGVEVSVKDGVVTLSGEVDRKSTVPIAERLTRAVDGVVDVVNDLGYDIDDTVSPVRYSKP